MKAIIDEVLVSCLFCEQVDISPDKHIVNDLYADSVALLDITMALEERFGFDFNKQDIEQFETVGDLYEIVMRNTVTLQQYLNVQ